MPPWRGAQPWASGARSFPTHLLAGAHRTKNGPVTRPPSSLAITTSFASSAPCTRLPLPRPPTTIGDSNLFCSYAHIGHESTVGSHCVFSNNATLGGHVHVGDYVVIGGLTAVHQFCRIGESAMLGGLRQGDSGCSPLHDSGWPSRCAPHHQQSRAAKARFFPPSKSNLRCASLSACFDREKITANPSRLLKRAHSDKIRWSKRWWRPWKNPNVASPERRPPPIVHSLPYLQKTPKAATLVSALPMAPKENSPSPRAHLLGMGLDNEDGHQRLTRAEKFTIVGGSERRTHEKMTETLLKTMESLKRRGRETGRDRQGGACRPLAQELPGLSFRAV